jgi:hypothetical protein
VVGPGGVGRTFATTTDTVDQKPGEGKGKRQRGKIPQDKDDNNSSDGSDKQDRTAKKKPKCFSCGGDHYINQCPEFLEFKKKERGRKTSRSDMGHDDLCNLLDQRDRGYRIQA